MKYMAYLKLKLRFLPSEYPILLGVLHLLGNPAYTADSRSCPSLAWMFLRTCFVMEKNSQPLKIFKTRDDLATNLPLTGAQAPSFSLCPGQGCRSVFQARRALRGLSVFAARGSVPAVPTPTGADRVPCWGSLMFFL